MRRDNSIWWMGIGFPFLASVQLFSQGRSVRQDLLRSSSLGSERRDLALSRSPVEANESIAGMLTPYGHPLMQLGSLHWMHRLASSIKNLIGLSKDWHFDERFSMWRAIRRPLTEIRTPKLV